MEGKSFVSEQLANYIDKVALQEAPILARLREETSVHPEAQMQITAQQGQFLQILVKAIRARRTLEVGVFTGYSSLAVAMAIPEDGCITALDVSDEFTRTARRYWAEAKISSNIDLRIGPASETLGSLIEEGLSGTYDFAFIDADKPSYPVYFEKCLMLVRQFGLIAIDNTLQHGRVLDESDNAVNTVAIREFNLKLRDDPRVLITLLPIADGLTLAVKL